MSIRSIQKAAAIAALTAVAAFSRAQFATSVPGPGIHDFVLNGTHYHIFESSGTLNVTTAGSVTVFLVAGGGGGGGTQGSGGGAGGVIAPVAVNVPVGQIAITVGAGGAGGDGYGLANPQGWPGGSSSFGPYKTATGGGGGADNGGLVQFSPAIGNGGSGGGSGWDYSAGSPATTTGQGTAGQGNNGGTGPNGDYGAGGGGAGATGQGSNTGQQPPNGGAGLTYAQYASFATAAGSFRYGFPAGSFGGGGGGGASVWKNYSGETAGPGSGGQGGGNGSMGNGGPNASMNGVQFTGGGGGGAGYDGHQGVPVSGGSGGSGLVIVSYPVASTPGAPTITGNGTSSGAEGVPFSYQVNATGSPTSYAVASGTLPQGLALASINGIEYISGTPAAGSASAAAYNITLTASNTGGTSAAFPLAITISAASQPSGPSAWTDNASGSLYNTAQANNVGIGTTTPHTRLEVSSGAAGGSGLRFTNLNSSSQTASGQPLGVDASGNVVTVPASVSGFNGDYNSLTNKPNNYLPSFRGNISANTMTNTFNLPVNTQSQYGDPGGTGTLDILTDDADGGGGFGLIGGNMTPFISSPVVWLYSNHQNAFTVAIKTAYTGGHPELAGENMVPALQVRETGKVLIGKVSSSPGTNYLLDVAGDVRANKLTVNTTGADFVFSPTYKLKPLSELKSYLEKNRHLPGIAPASEMQKGGVEVGESQTKLLQKVEELTLYMIAQDKKQAEQEKLIAGMKKELDAMKNKEKQPR